MRKNNKYSRDVHVETSFLLNMTRNRDCHVRTTSFLAMTIVGLFSFNVQAECTPTPDCASIGYTETYCEGDFIKCPFDTSKLHCTPCDSKYQYSCDGKYATASIGNTCNGKYAGCECVDGAKLGSSTCECNTACIVGAIYYSDGTCSSCVEDAKTPVGVVVKDKEIIIMGLSFPKLLWSATNVDVTELVNISDKSSAKLDYAGAKNTSLIVSYFDDDTDEASNAAVYCNKYSPLGLDTSKGQWYLPAIGELYNYLYLNYATLLSTYKRLGISTIQLRLSSSTEYSSTNNWFLTTDNGDFGWIGKYSSLSVACFLRV